MTSFNKTSGNLQLQNSKIQKPSFLSGLLDKYLTYTDQQETYKIYWYLKVVILFPCFYMVLSIMAMAELVHNFEYFIGFSMMLFFANIIIHIVGAKSRIYVSLYHFSELLFVLIPLLTYWLRTN